MKVGSEAVADYWIGYLSHYGGGIWLGRLAVRYVLTASNALFAIVNTQLVQSPTGSDHSAVATVPDSEPWKDGNQASSGKYKYHPYNDVNRPAVDAPSALNTVVIPNVTLPKVRHP